MLNAILKEIKNPPSSIKLFNSIRKRPYSFYLDSSCGTKKLNRFSFLGCEPFLVFRSKGSSISLEWEDGRREEFESDPFSALKSLFKKYSISGKGNGIPFLSGGVGYFAYDMKNFIEDLPDTARDDLKLPDCIFGFYDAVIVYDNLAKRAYIASSGVCEKSRRDARVRALARLRHFKEIIGKPPDEEMVHRVRPRCRLKSNFSKKAYKEMVSKAKQYIKKGDIYQVNLSQRFETELVATPFELYCRLRVFSPAPFSAYIDFKDVIILSSSPERFLRKTGRYIETRPIKGTRPRGADEPADILLEKELLSSGKDRAEHIMIVDLERNDLGRVSQYGSVKPSDLFEVEKYSTVSHLVSTVSGKLKKGLDAVDCLLAAFPGGSITGAPKIRAMEIINELEGVRRNIYTGAIGYISFDGNMDTSIVIRTLFIKDKMVYFNVGGGIVADSDPEMEYRETLDKAKGIMRALGGTVDIAKR